MSDKYKTKFPPRRKDQSIPTPSDVKLPKIPRLEMPDDFKIRTQPLFSLPEEVLKLPPPTKKSMRAKMPVQKKRSSGKILNN